MLYLNSFLKILLVQNITDQRIMICDIQNWCRFETAKKQEDTFDIFLEVTRTKVDKEFYKFK